jgi:hypothetical protein
MWKKVLSYSFSKVYNTPEKVEDLRNAINAETWLGAHIETGSHALCCLQPIGEYEMISIKCVLTDSKSMCEGAIKSKIINYWKHKWL